MRISVLIAVASLTLFASGRDVLVSFMPQPGQGASCIERYTVEPDGTWRVRGVWRARPATGLAAFGDGWIYTAGGKSIGRFRRDATPDNGPYVRTAAEFQTFAVSPDNRWFHCANFVTTPGVPAKLQRYLVSDPAAGGVYVSRERTPALRLDTTRQLAFGPDGLLYVGCRGSSAPDARRGVAALDVSGGTPREAAFYPMPGAMAGFAFTPAGTHLVVHGGGKGRIFALGRPDSFRDVSSGLRNSFCAMRMDGAWYCGDYADGAVKRCNADGTFTTVATLRTGLTALLCLDDVGPEVTRACDVPVAPALCGPYERLKYNSTGTCDLKVGLWAFPLPMDLNADGIDDLVVATPDTPWAGAFFFAGTKEGVFKAPVRLSGQRTWNISSSIVDGEPVVMTPSRTYWDFRRNGFGENEMSEPADSRLSARGTMRRFADLDGDGVADRIVFHGGRATWEKCLSPRSGPGAAYASGMPLRDANGAELRGVGVLSDLADFDGDGDLDIVSASGVDGFAWRENVGTRDRPIFAAARVLHDTTGTNLHVFVCMNVPCAWDWDRDGRFDILAGDEDGRVHWFRNTGTRDAAGSPVFEPGRPFRQERADLGQGVLVAPSACDWDGDGDLDLICGDSAGSLSFIENLSGPGVARPSWAEPRLLSCEGAGGMPSEWATNAPVRLVAGPTGSIQGPGEAKWGYTSPVVVDWDGDGVLDVLENSVWGYVYWHRNLGTRTAPRLGPAEPVEVEWDGKPAELAWGANKPRGKGLMTQWRTTPLGTDWDGDGLPDLVMLDPEGYLALYRRALRDGRRILQPPVRVFLDEATGRPIRLNDGVAGRSGRRKLCTMDWDGDGMKDFFVSSSLYHQHEVGVSVDFWRQTRAADGVWYFRNLGRLSPSRLHGHSCAPTPVDFDADGVPDILVGGEDGFFYFLRNPRSDTTARPTLMVNEDPWYFIGHRPESEMNVEGLRRHVDRYAAGGKVTHLVFCVNGMRTAYPSAVTEPMWRTVLADGTVLEDSKNRLKAFFDAGVDPFQVWIDRCREAGISPWVSMRINDIHHIDSGDPRSSCAFWRRHPELRRCQEDPVKSGKWWTSFAFNYAKPEVRDYAFALFKEIADRYDADGYELDTLRFQEHLTPGREREEAHFLTEFILRCRAYTRELERARGHRILLSARTLSSYAASRAYGFDPESWAKEGAIDWLVVCNFFNTVDYEFDFADWRRRIQAANPHVRVLPGATDCFDCEACRLDADAYRGWADQMYAQGADGVYLYNTSYLGDDVKEDLCRNGLASGAVRMKGRRYPRTHHDCVPKGLPTGRRLPVPLDAARVFPVIAGRGARDGELASVVLGLGWADAPAPAVSVNGVPAVGTPVKLPNGAKYGPDRKTKAVWRYALPPGAVKPGENEVRVGALPASNGLLHWVELDLR